MVKVLIGVDIIVWPVIIQVFHYGKFLLIKMNCPKKKNSNVMMKQNETKNLFVSCCVEIESQFD